jgi:lipopolysaccharide assembly protein B
MEIELWYLLVLPVLFAAGWLARGFEARAQASDQAGLPRSYFRGLNFLLNDQHDKAIDAFIEVVKLDPETIELHHALGNLFRRRGEFDRAVRIHTHLLNRADLPAHARTQALAELGQDYLKGGLLDRAEDAFTRLLDDPHQRFDALRALLRIYQMEREWLKAVDCARRLEREAGESHSVAISHYFCELASTALEQGRFEQAEHAIDEALGVHRKSVRALILAGDLEDKRGRRDEALRQWQRVEAISLEHVPLIAARVAEAMDAAGQRTAALNWLRHALLDAPSTDLLDVAVERVAAWEGPSAAEALVLEQLRRSPSLLGFERLLDTRLAMNKEDEELQLLANLLRGQTRKLARYRCTRCGFRAREYHWHCPGCSGWDTYPPRRIEEFDVA